jgi:BMFP domain-containing protein YqiC
MERQNFIHDFQQRLMELFRASPAGDLERNLKALMGQTFSRLDLVTREEFDVQVELLRALRQRVQALEDRLGPSGISPRSWSETGPDVVPGESAMAAGAGSSGLGAVAGSTGLTGSSASSAGSTASSGGSGSMGSMGSTGSGVGSPGIGSVASVGSTGGSIGGSSGGTVGGTGGGAAGGSGGGKGGKGSSGMGGTGQEI